MSKLVPALLILSVVAIGYGLLHNKNSQSHAEYRTIDAKNARNLMAADKSALLLDVREPHEYNSAHIEGAVNIPLRTIGIELNEQLTDLDRAIIVYCRSGVRSREAAEKLLSLGYNYVYDLGGMYGWDEPTD